MADAEHAADGTLTAYQRTGNSFEDSDYESFGMVDEENNLTNAGALLSNESPIKHCQYMIADFIISQIDQNVFLYGK